MKKLVFFLILFISFSNLFSQEGENQENKNKKIINMDFPGHIKVNLGLNIFLDSDEAMKMGTFSSRSFGLNYMKPLFLTDNFSFSPALGLEFENYSFKNNVIINYKYDVDDNQVNFIDTLNIDSKKNKLVNSTLELPLSFRYHFGNSDEKKNRLFIGIGVDFGVRLNSFTKLKHIKNNKSIVNKSKNDFGLSNYRYSLSFICGNDNFNFFIKYFLSDFFQSENNPEYIIVKPIVIKTGFSFSLF